MGKIPILTNIFQVGWNHQPVKDLFHKLSRFIKSTIWSNYNDRKNDLFDPQNLKLSRGNPLISGFSRLVMENPK